AARQPPDQVARGVDAHVPPLGVQAVPARQPQRERPGERLAEQRERGEREAGQGRLQVAAPVEPLQPLPPGDERGGQGEQAGAADGPADEAADATPRAQPGDGAASPSPRGRGFGGYPPSPQDDGGRPLTGTEKLAVGERRERPERLAQAGPGAGQEVAER